MMLLFQNFLNFLYVFISISGKWDWRSTKQQTETFHFFRDYSGKHWITEKNGSKTHVTKMNERDALEFLRIRPKNQTFMLSVNFFAPHSMDKTKEQYFPQPESMNLYANETVAVPISATPEEWNKLPYFFEEANEARKRWHWRFDEPSKHQEMMKNYFRLVTEIDTTSRVLYDELERQGVLNETLIIFTTDNGLFHSEHQMAGKWFPYEESIRVPLVIKDPRMPKKKHGSTNDEFALNIDLAPTMLGAARILPSDVMQGRDISDLYLERKPKEWRQEYFYEFPGINHPATQIDSCLPSNTALVRKGMKFIQWTAHSVEQLFNLTGDPLEMNDVVNRPEYKEVLGEMRTRHDELKAAALEPGPIDESGEQKRGIFDPPPENVTKVNQTAGENATLNRTS